LQIAFVCSWLKILERLRARRGHDVFAPKALLS
jgi:hypothetical protein